MPEAPIEFVVEGFWVVHSRIWTDYFVRCSGRFFHLGDSYDGLVEVRELPVGAEQMNVLPRHISGQCKNFLHPTPAMLGKVFYWGTAYGDDITALLENGGAFRRCLSTDPGSGDAIPTMRFYDPGEISGATLDQADLDPVCVFWLPTTS